jgi:spore maturation protein A
MLNYIWLGLIVIGVTIAIAIDVSDISTDKYRNNQPLTVQIDFKSKPDISSKDYQDCEISFTRQNFSDFYRLERTTNDTLKQTARVKFSEDKSKSLIQIAVNGNTPAFWKDMSKNQGKLANQLTGMIDLRNLNDGLVSAKSNIVIDPIKFVKLNKVTNEGAIKYAQIAVELAIGLIGIMALWLGLMKIAEEAGLVAMFARALRPVTTKLFPDVPPDHPAMGAMIMNISANMLGLGNAATPLGLKAMEELNKLSKKAGTATNAMATFLVINTSNVQLIPATVIAIRAAAGSSNPTEIIGPVIAATAINLTVGITTCKILEKLPIFKKQLEPETTNQI